MKKIVCALIMSAAFGTTASAGTIDSVGNYRGTIDSVAVGFFSGIGVSLTDGVTCNGNAVVYLPFSHDRYKDILATLLSAQAGGQNVRLYRMLDTISTFPGGYSYCTITAAAIGDFPPW